jgi:GT2 family glycosyltransferase
MTGIAKCHTKYALICDDDVKFESDFVKNLYAPMEKEGASFSAAPLYSFLPQQGFQALVCTIMASATHTIFHKERYVSILRSSGYSYNRHLDRTTTVYYESQSLPWTCFFARTKAFEKLNFEAETWIDSQGYAALDDQTMFYKAWLRGLKTIVVSTAQYEHMDAKTSTRNNKPTVNYASTYNRVVFWHRFIYSMQPNLFLKLYSRVCFGYYMTMLLAFDLLSVVRKKITLDDISIKRKGYFDGWKYLKSQEYRNLPPIREGVL